MFDKAGSEYWSSQWSGRALPRPIDPNGDGIDNFMIRRYHRLFSELFQPFRHTGASLIEVGCGGSSWLPYFAREYGFRISGIDYSLEGCELSRAIHDAEGVSCDLIQGDVFELPPSLLHQFDVVYSHGLAEHFVPTERVVAVMRRLLKPNGFMLTIIPNLRYVPAILQKIIDRSIYDIHVPLSIDDLRHAHEASGLHVERADFIGTLHLGVMNFTNKADKWWAAPGQRLCSWMSKGIWMLEDLGVPEMRNPITSPYSFCWATNDTL